jgi:mannosyltransferase OCH1-like enzyme
MNTIPKVIHYCWFGGKEKPQLIKECMNSWKEKLPDYKIVEWNEKNFNVEEFDFSQKAYKAKKWAFVADYCRIWALYNYGGIYLDTDMEITNDISKYLENEIFFGQEDSKMINAAVVWCKSKNNKHISNIVKLYEEKEKFNSTGDLYEESVPRILTEYFEKRGFNDELEEIQILESNIYVYPMEYFYPLSYDHQNNKFTNNSCMIHHFDSTWVSKMEKIKTNLKRKNLKWIVNIIDLFISIKNFIKSFINYKDIVLFISIFMVFILLTLSFMPIDDFSDKNYIFNDIKHNFPFAVIQILAFSFIWCYICKKIRLIEVNKLLDTMTNNKENHDEEQKKNKSKKLSEENKLYITKFENRIYLFEYIFSIILSLTPIVFTFIIIPSKEMIFSLTILLLSYLLYLGIKKNFKYRILDLVPLSILLAFVSLYIPYNGLIISIPIFILVLILILKNNVMYKKILFYIFSTILFLALFIVMNLTFFNLKSENANIDKVSLVNFDKTDVYENYTNYFDINTEFNAGKKVLNETVFKNLNTNVVLEFLLRPTLIIYISVLIVFLLILLNKEYKYCILALTILLNLFVLNNVSISSCIYSLTNYLIFYLLLIILTFCINRKFINRK